MRRLLPLPTEDLDADGLDTELSWPQDRTADPRHRSWCRGVMVASVDGAARGGDERSGSISTPADRRVFSALRGRADVILVGAGTVRAEGYQAARSQERYAAGRAATGQSPDPVIAVVSGRLDLDLESLLFTRPRQRPIVFVTENAAAQQVAAARAVADVIVCGTEHVDLAVALTDLAGRGLLRVSCEGGPSLLGAVATAGLLDELHLSISPMLIGGDPDLGRILSGPGLPDGPVGLALAGILEEDGTLFVRYTRAQ